MKGCCSATSAPCYIDATRRLRRLRTGREEGTISPEQIVFLALVQGLTEFAPVSSSAHLALMPILFGGRDQGLLIDVAAHVGTLLAVMAYFHPEMRRIIRGCCLLLMGNWQDPDSRLALLLAIGTLPAVLAGGTLWALGLAEILRSVEAIGVFTIVFAVFLYWADRHGAAAKGFEQFGHRHAFWVGMAQVLAFLPGASRAGVAITAARALGFDRVAAARFAFLLAIPTIAAAGTLGAVEVVRSGEEWLQMSAAAVAALSFVSALGALWALMRFVRRWSLTPFVIYRIVLGAGLLTYAWS